MDALGLTSRWVAAARARETARADHLFDDPLAEALAGEEGMALLEEMDRLATPPGRPTENPYLAIRTRFFDDALLAATREGTRQLVILAAGMDARAFRLPWPDGTAIYEVEREDVLRYKEQVLARERAVPRARRIVVAADLREDWRAKLRSLGHDAARPTAILIEGLFAYLPDEPTVLAILEAAASIAAPGSRLGTDLVGRGFLESPYTKSYLRALDAKGVSWRFGTDEPEELLPRAGWSEVRVSQPGDEGVSFGRWPYPQAPREIRGVPRSFLVTARR